MYKIFYLYKASLTVLITKCVFSTTKLVSVGVTEHFIIFPY